MIFSQGRIQGFPKGWVETRDTKCGEGGGVLSALDPTRKAGGGGATRFRPDTKSTGRGGGGGGGGLSGASGPIQKAGKGEGLFSRRGGVTIYERGGCNPQTPPPPPGSASASGSPKH